MTARALPTSIDPGVAGDIPADDAAQLRAFARSGDSQAFAAIVRRHGPMVLGVCLRILQHRQDAEDAFQAVFIVLARKAAGIRPPQNLAGWLHGVALRTSLKARTLRSRRREVQAMAQLQASTPNARDAAARLDQADLAPILDQELMRLPDRWRVLLVLNVLEGRSKSDIAAATGIAQGTVSSRLARARDALRERLLRRGITLTTAALATALAAHAADAATMTVSEALIVQTTQAATLSASAGLAALPTGIAALSKGVLHAMFISKLTAIVAWALAIAIVGTGSGLLVHRAIAKDPAPAGKPGKPDAAEQGTQIRGGIISLEGDKLTIGTMEDGQKVQKTVFLIGDGGIALQPDTKGQDPAPGKRDQLIPGTGVTVTLEADGKTVRTVSVMGRSARGTIDAVDKDTVTVTTKGKEGPAATTKYKVNESTTVILSWGKEKSDVQKGTVADLKPGMVVSISVSAIEKDLARSITVQPPSANPKDQKEPKVK